MYLNKEQQKWALISKCSVFKKYFRRFYILPCAHETYLFCHTRIFVILRPDFHEKITYILCFNNTFYFVEELFLPSCEKS